MKIALVGDYDPNVTAHRAIPAAVEINANYIDMEFSIDWLSTLEIPKYDISEFSGVWCIPASPYQHMENVMNIIHYARTENIPFLGTCGGYQHAVLEYARNELRLLEADNVETNPNAKIPLITPLVCGLSSDSRDIRLEEDSVLYKIYTKGIINETYNCGFGVNRKLLSIFENSKMKFSAFNSDGDPQAMELDGMDFFVGVAFQPERSAFLGKPHPLITSFLKTIAKGY